MQDLRQADGRRRSRHGSDFDTDVDSDSVLNALDTGDNCSPIDEPLWPLSKLRKIPFHTYEHANGNADDVPQLLTAIVECHSDSVKVEEIMTTLSCSIIGQDTLYAATALTVPFLAYIAATCSSCEISTQVIHFLINLAIVSNPVNSPRVLKNVSRACGPLLRAIAFDPYQPTIRNISLCFLILVAPPEDTEDKSWIASVLKTKLKSKHPKFRTLIEHALGKVLDRSLGENVDFAQLESDVIEAAEEYETQNDERERLLVFCGKRVAESKVSTLPSDVLRNIKSFLYTTVLV